jgi:AGCS family alanine or glycine:cation symporter
MKKLFSVIAQLLLPILMIAQEAEKGLDEKINDLVKPATDLVANKIIFKAISIAGVEVPIVVIYLLLAATFFTIYFKFINLSGFKIAINTVRGKYDDIDHHEADPADGPLVVDGDVKGTLIFKHLQLH